MNLNLLKASLRGVFVLLAISSAFIGSDCEDTTIVPKAACSGNQVDLIGRWKFVANLGGIRDVCPGEIVEFGSSGTASLTCPNQPTIQRSYSVSTDHILTYTETNVKYCISGNTDELQLTGMNNNRILIYTKVITRDQIEKKQGYSATTFYNSSELTK